MNRWTAEDEAILETMINNDVPIIEQAKRLGRTPGAVQQRTSNIKNGNTRTLKQPTNFYMFLTLNRQFLIFGQSTNPIQRVEQYTYANTCEEIVFLTKDGPSGFHTEKQAKVFWANRLDDKYKRGLECYAVGHLSQSELEKALKDFEVFLGFIDIINDVKVSSTNRGKNSFHVERARNRLRSDRHRRANRE